MCFHTWNYSCAIVKSTAITNEHLGYIERHNIMIKEARNRFKTNFRNLIIWHSPLFLRIVRYSLYESIVRITYTYNKYSENLLYTGSSKLYVSRFRTLIMLIKPKFKSKSDWKFLRNIKMNLQYLFGNTNFSHLPTHLFARGLDGKSGSIAGIST